jgi:UDP-glucose 4-epimerase
MKALITGGAGFIGSNLAERLIARGDEVSVVDNITTGRIENLAHLLDSRQIRIFVDTVCNPVLMEALIREADHVYHLASPVGVKYIMEHPVLTILDAARGADVVFGLCNKYRKKVLLASTSEVYGKNLDFLGGDARKLGEEDFRLKGSTKNHRWAYANTKSMEEFLAFAYFREYRMPVVVVRFFNTVGPRQTGRYGMVVPTLIQQALAGEPMTVFGTGQQSRCFLHVADAIDAATALMAEPKAIGDVFNIGSEEEVTVSALAAMVKERTGSSSEIVNVDYKTAYGDGFEDMLRRTPDTTKLRELVGFRPKLNLERTLDEIIAYYRRQTRA